jgi:hypothetical protein
MQTSEYVNSKFKNSKLRFCKPNIVSELTVVHYGSKKYKKSLVKPVRNRNFVKPHGGLWTSPVNSKWGWKEWCKSSEFRECNEKNSFKLKFNADAKILIINSYDDLENIPNKSLCCITCMDFELLATMCDAIWLTKKGCSETHLSHPLSLYGWDCESVLILNSKYCYQV